MDKKLLDALNNLSVALQAISDSLDESNRTKETTSSSITEAFKSLDITEQLKSIDEGIKKIQADNKEIIKTQKQTLSIAQSPTVTDADRKERMTLIQQLKDALKKKSTTTTEGDKIGSLGDPSKKKTITDGVKMILLIAVGVLAIGAAFKILGQVDFKTVIALAIAMPLLAFAFEKVANIKTNLKDLGTSILGLIMMAGALVVVSKILNNVTPISAGKLFTVLFIGAAFVALSFSIKKMVNGIEGVDIKNLWKLPIVLVAASVAITASSWILQLVKPVGFLQLLTVVFIAGAFATLAYSIGKLAKGVSEVSVKDLWKLPLVLVAASAAITASSWILQFVKPVGFLQLLTVIFIAGAFTLLSFGLGKLAKAVSDVSLKGVAMMPLVLVGVSIAIAASSHILSTVKPISFTQALTTIFIAATFTIISYGLPRIAQAVKNIGLVEAALMPIVLVAIAAAITASSYLFAEVKVIPFMTLLNIAVQAVVLAVASVVMGAAIWALDKLKIDPIKATMGGLSIIIIATTVMLSSLILSMGTYEKYPSLTWTIGTAASMLAFGIGMALIGGIKTKMVGVSGIGIPALVIGAIGIAIIAATILATDSILSSGTYEKYPSLPWSMGVGASIVAFGAVMAVAGFGIIAIALGAISIRLIANAIVSTSNILSTGNFTGGPSIGWAVGTSVLIATYGAALMTLGAFIGGTFGLGYLALLAGASAVNVVAQSIVDASYILSSGNYKDGPTKEWAEGVALSIGAFAPVYKTLTSKGLLGAIFGGGGSSPAKMKQAIVTISEGIITAAQFFSKNTVSFKNGPPVEWAEGVGLSIRAFTPVFESLAKNKSWFSSGLDMDEMVNAVHGISQGIITSAEIFNQNRTIFGGTYPSVEWAEGVGLAIRAFNPVIEYAASISGITSNVSSDWLYKNITFFAKAMVETANILSGNYEGSRGKPNYNNIIPDNYTQTLTSLYSSFYKLVSDKKIASLDSDNFGVFYAMAGSISNTSIILSKGNYKLIPLDYMTNLTSNIIQYSKLLSYLKGTNESETKLLGLVTISRASDITRMASDYDKLANSIQNLSGAIQSIDVERITALKTLTGSIVLMSLMDSDQFNSMMDSLESKAKIFVDVINDMENGVSGKEISINAGGAKQSGPTMQDVVNVMSRMDAKLGQLVSYSSSISLKINEIKTNKGIKGK
jgi:hypothetical protein